METFDHFVKFLFLIFRSFILFSFVTAEIAYRIYWVLLLANVPILYTKYFLLIFKIFLGYTNVNVLLLFDRLNIAEICLKFSGILTRMHVRDTKLILRKNFKPRKYVHVFILKSKSGLSNNCFFAHVKISSFVYFITKTKITYDKKKIKQIH